MSGVDRMQRPTFLARVHDPYEVFARHYQTPVPECWRAEAVFVGEPSAHYQSGQTIALETISLVTESRDMRNARQEAAPSG